MPQLVVTGHAIDAADIGSVKYRGLTLKQRNRIDTFEYDTNYDENYENERSYMRHNGVLIDTKYDLLPYEDKKSEFKVCVSGNYGCN